MKKLVLSALCAVAFAACGGGDDDGNGIVVADSGPTADAAEEGLPCNPVTQAGCEAGEKCAELVESEEPRLTRTACVPDGEVPAGGACTQGAAGPTTGFDDCVAGYECLGGACTEICNTAPDSCRSEDQAFGDGSYCTLFADLFNDSIGLCVPGCIPTDDESVNGAVVHNTCGEGNGCYAQLSRAAASCAGVPEMAANQTQNKPCYGPNGVDSGSCFLNGCASGFSAALNDEPGDAATKSVCSRYCLPANTHDQQTADASGTGGNCTLASLGPIGGVGPGPSADHQCRFLQSFYSNTDQLPADVGMCVPTLSPGGNSWADCTILPWEDIVADWNAAVAAGEDPNAAFDAICVDETDPDNPELKEECLGYFRGCLSLDEDTRLMDPAGGGGTAASAVNIRQALGERLNVPSMNMDNAADLF